MTFIKLQVTCKSFAVLHFRPISLMEYYLMKALRILCMADEVQHIIN
eukprot:UN01022